MEPLGLYVHIPFCTSKCHYCAFASFPHPSEKSVEEYVKALIREIKTYEGTDAVIRTLYYGGGTPSSIPVTYIEEIMSALAESFHFDPHDPEMEKTIEVNPATALEEKLCAYHQMGFNRLSMGLQAAQDHLLKSIGRVHTLKDFDTAVQSAEKAGFDNISTDVIFGLPGQTLGDISETIDHLLSFKSIKHISCYSLSVEEGTPFSRMAAEGKLILPDEKTEREMYYTIRDRLKEKGLLQYEISNFALPGYESRHNSAYWDLTPYMGLGLSASSFYKGSRYTNTDDLTTYCSQWSKRPHRSECHQLSDQELRGDFMFLGLRRKQGVDDRDYHAKFGRSFFQDYEEEIKALIRQGLLYRSDTQICLTDKGMDLANQVFMAFV